MDINTVDSINYMNLEPLENTSKLRAIAPWQLEQDICNQIFNSLDFLEFRQKDYSSPFSLNKRGDGSYLLESENYILIVEVKTSQPKGSFCGKASYELAFSLHPK